MTAKERDRMHVMLDALYSILNIEGATEFGGQSGAYNGVDIEWHFDKVRRAINLVDPEGMGPSELTEV